MLTYTAKHNKLDDAELKVRKVVQYYALIAINSGLRVGEQRQLRWSIAQIEQHKVNGEEQKLAIIHVRAETNKVRTSRTLLCRYEQYFERLREISNPKNADELIITVDNKTELCKRTLLYDWHKMIELADIAARETRDLCHLQLASHYDYAAYYEWINV